MTQAEFTSDDVLALFSGADGDFHFARWGRPIAPIVFGVEDQTLSVVKGAFEAVAAVAGHHLAETDPEFGSNCMMFFFREWSELLAVPDLDRLVPDLAPLVARLEAGDASQYRVFRFDETGAIKAAFVFLRMQGALAEMPAETLALAQVAQIMLLWSERAFAERSPLAIAGETVILRPEIAGVLKAAYDPVLPPVSRDATTALRLAARLGVAI
ncbi:hypothetical protein LCL97_20315 [Seohaeicola saemankumensis]|nr:hypothetical protein [Seohaeicola saemankumensis]MCA0873181.1 hypothetical protein [Seohaeicola saemankumensis]